MGRRIRKPKIIKPPERGYYSYSQISQYLDCARKYKLNYVDKIPKIGIDVYMTFGTYGHKFIADVLEPRLNKKDLTPKQIKNLQGDMGLEFKKELRTRILEYLEQVPSMESQYSNKAIEMGSTELRRQFNMLGDEWCRTLYPEIDPIAVEKEIRLDIDGIPFLMFIDLIEKTKKGDKILDWKFTTKKKPQNITDSSLQLSTYSIATDIRNVGFGALIRAQPGKENRWKPRVEVTNSYRTTHELNWAKQIIREAVLGIQAKQFPRCSPEHFLCNEKWCDFWVICRGKDIPQKPDWM